jgi:hypothetical protein
MEIKFEDIRRRAFQLWELAGKPDGMSDKFWEDAKRELEFVAARDELKMRDDL